MRTRTQIYLAGAALFLVSLPLAPVTVWRAHRPKPRPYREEMRKRNQLSTLLGAEVAEGTEYLTQWTGPRRVA